MNPPRADSVGGFFGRLAKKINPRWQSPIENWVTSHYKGPEIRKSLPRTLTELVTRGKVPGDKCYIEYVVDGEIKVLQMGSYSLSYTAEQIRHEGNREKVRKNAFRLAHKARADGASILSLGAQTKEEVLDGGYDIIDALRLANKGEYMSVVSGNTHTIATCIEVALAASAKMGITLYPVEYSAETRENIKVDTIGVVGARGSIGNICSQMLAPYCNNLILFGNPTSGPEVLEAQAKELRAAVHKRYGNVPNVGYSISLDDLKSADLVISATNSPNVVINPGMLKRGGLIIDVARPHDTAQSDLQAYTDNGNLVVDGGIVYVADRKVQMAGEEVIVSSDINLRSMNLGEGCMFACSAEAPIMAIANARGQTRLTDLIKTTVEGVELMQWIGADNGFKITERFRSHYVAVEDEQIEEIMAKAQGS